MHQHLAVVRFLNEVIQHALRHFEIGDDAIFHRADRNDVTGRAAEHLLRFFADCFHLAGVLVERDNGGLVDHDPFSLGKNEGVSSTKIDGEIGREKAEERAKVHESE